jgi:DNA polymerase-3 subunit epsilon/ATP-dependent DNA helicase DinG
MDEGVSATRCSVALPILGPFCSGRSFWEADVPGEALSVWCDGPPTLRRADGSDRLRPGETWSPFDQYSLPEAILRFRQGFGRLIRTKSDRGAVVILDRRILTKRYGPLFLKSLPTCTQRQGPLREAPREVARWLGV